MKKHILCLGVLAVSGAANAQSSVTLFGVVDTGLGFGSGSLADRAQLISGANGTARVGFRGTEDLGGGLSAGFWLEAGLLTDDGRGGPSNTNNQASGAGPAQAGSQGLTFNRRSTVSLVAPWGEVRAGRDHVAHYRAKLEFEPFQNVGVGAFQPHVGSIGGPTSSRVSNFIGYYLPPNIGGFYGFAQYYLGENADNVGATQDDGSGASIRVGYAKGPFNLSLATGRTQYARTATTGDIRSSNIGASWRFGPVNVMGGYFADKVQSTAPVMGRGGSIGASIAAGAGEVRVALSSYGTDAGTSPKTKKFALGYVHNLSKRTALYATYARVRNSGGAASALNGSLTAANQGSSGLDMGIRHAF
jgi:predicted porin